MTKQYGILAYPAKHSLSPLIQNAAFKAMEMDAEYGIFEISEDEVPVFFDRVRAEKISGLSVSLPYKETVIKFLDEISDNAKNIGAVNTVINKDGVLYGDNTDFIGSNMALHQGMAEIENKKVVIIGAGGAARAVAYGLMLEGADVYLMNRTKEKADRIAMDFAEIFDSEIHSGGFDKMFRGEILINASSIWKDQQELPDFCNKTYVGSFSLVMDINYKPLLTPLLECAKTLGRRIITGEKMLIYQAMAQFKLWTGKEAPREVMEKALNDAL